MKTIRIAVITKSPSDFTRILNRLPDIQIRVMKPEDVLHYDLDLYDALCILGGTAEQPVSFGARERLKVEEQMDKGTRVFCEYCSSIALIYSAEPESTRFSRLICTTDDLSPEGLEQHLILDDQCNNVIRPFFANQQARPLLLYKKYINAHRPAEVGEAERNDISHWALWLERPNLMICSFRICNFNRARFAPLEKWRVLVAHILTWLTSRTVRLDSLKMPYQTKGFDPHQDVDAQVRQSVVEAVAWFERADILMQNGKGGVREGLGTEIYANGEQKRLNVIRNDCTGEASFLHFMDYLLNGNRTSLEVSDNLMAFCFDALQIKEGAYRGMMRWTETAWGVCYADDAARVIYPQLLKGMYNGTNEYIEEIKDALHFLVKTTGTDGIRTARTDLISLDEKQINHLAANPTNGPSAHYNAFYLGSLLLYSKITGDEQFKEIAVRGMETLMHAYPDTAREHSETQELCRLIMPLAWLYWVTGEERHKEYLYRVTNDLMRFKHPSGGYLEWDTGYKANCSNNDTGECSLLARNGDPVVDLLYSVNWLPMAYMQAYFVTKDSYFKKLWEDMATFMLNAQIHSDNGLIHGAWARGFDVERMEVFGIPNDTGWGPWAIESGWTVAEIASGLAAGLLSDRLKDLY